MATLVCGGRIRGDKKNGGGKGVGASFLAGTPPRKRLLLTTPRPSCEVGESSAAAAVRQPGPTD
ncbi:hypothetical protein Tco_0163868, partial [Tanacetum coccineum]